MAQSFPYTLTNGSLSDLVTVQADGPDMLFQIFYSGLIAADVEVRVSISTNKDGPFCRIMGAEKLLIGADNTAYISLSGVNFGHVRFSLYVPTPATAGTITKVEVLK